jgi:glycosyltransferase (TIGR04182 family)
MVDRDAVCVLVPTYNEAETIERVVASFVEQGFENVLVIDGGSTDGTRDLAKEAGARVVRQSGRGEGKGKGQAVREGLEMSDAPVVLMLDGDWTYRVEDAEAMLKPIFEGRADHVIGDRFADMEDGAMSRLNRFGNGIINRAFRLIYGRNYGDILSGYRAMTREAIQRVTLTEDGFGVETELAVECVKHNVRTAVVPIRYRARPDESQTNLRPFRDGGIIILTLYKMAKTNNPLFYFGSVGAASSSVGVLLGLWVAAEWVFRSISHEVIAVVSAFAILVGVQLLMFGFLSDMIVQVNREQTQRLEELTERLGDATDSEATVGAGTDESDVGTQGRPGPGSAGPGAQGEPGSQSENDETPETVGERESIGTAKDTEAGDPIK